MNFSENLLEVKEYSQEGYRPLIDYGEWRVAVLNYCEELLPENIDKMQKHNQTDEVFVLLKGSCTLYLAEGEDEIKNIYAQKMEPFKLYNVKKSVWHTHSLSSDGSVLIVENRNTGLDNSPEIQLSPAEREKIVELSEQ